MVRVENQRARTRLFVTPNPILPKALNLRDSADINEFARIIESHPALFPFLVADLRAGLDAIRQLTPPAFSLRALTIDYVNVPIRKGQNLAFPIGEIVDIGRKLASLAAAEGFEEFAAKFGNPPQINDTIFELYAASFIFGLPHVSNLRFEPEFTNLKGKRKRPEFEFRIAERQFASECKVIHHNTHHSNRRFEEISKHLLRAISGLWSGQGIRIDIALKGAINENPESFGARVAARIGNSPSIGQSGIVGAASYHVTSRMAPPSFEALDFRQGWSDSTMFPIQTDRKTGIGPSTRLWITGEDRKLATTAGALLTEASQQLPLDRSGLIFLRGSFTASVALAIDRRLRDKTHNHVLCILVDSSGSKLNVRCRSGDLALVTQILNDPRVQISLVS